MAERERELATRGTVNGRLPTEAGVCHTHTEDEQEL